MNQLSHPDFKEVFVICCTNAPESLDVAIYRRFTFVHLGMPSLLDRKDLFKTYLNGNHSLADKELEKLAEMTNQFTCADVEKVVSLAATFFYQKIYRNFESEIPLQNENKEGQEISFKELTFAVENSSPSTDAWQLFDTKRFHSKNKNVIFP